MQFTYNKKIIVKLVKWIDIFNIINKQVRVSVDSFDIISKISRFIYEGLDIIKPGQQEKHAT